MTIVSHIYGKYSANDSCYHYGVFNSSKPVLVRYSKEKSEPGDPQIISVLLPFSVQRWGGTETQRGDWGQDPGFHGESGS